MVQKKFKKTFNNHFDKDKSKNLKVKAIANIPSFFLKNILIKVQPLNSLKNFFSILEFKIQKNLIFLFILKIISGLFDMIGIASLGPIILILTDDKFVDNNNYAIKVKEFLDIDNQSFVLLIIAISAILIFLNILIRFFSVWADQL